MKNKTRQNRIKQTSELFTPDYLVKDIINKMLIYKPNMIKDKNTIMDNACGNGNILIEIIKLKSVYHDPISVLSSIYGVDIMQDNVHECKQRILALLNPNTDLSEIKAILDRNIVVADGLTYNYLFGRETPLKVDYVLTNPPYSTKSNPSYKKTKQLWHLFILKDIDLLNDNGVLMSITPAGWRNVNGAYERVKTQIYKNNLMYLEIHDVNDGKATFSSSTRYDICILNKSKYNGVTKIIDQDGISHEINIHDWCFLPNGRFDDIKEYLDMDAVQIEIDRIMETIK